MANFNATNAPVILAVLVPPSAWITSQSTMILRSLIFPSLLRTQRPIRRWISIVLPESFPLLLSLRFLVLVARGSILYSAVTHPVPVSLKKGNRIFYCCRTNNCCITKTDHYRSFWIFENICLKLQFAKLLGFSPS